MMNHRIWVYHGFFPCFFSQTRHVILCTSNGFPCRLLLTPLLDHHVTQRGFFPRIPHPNIKDRILKIFPKSASLEMGKKHVVFSQKIPDIPRVEPLNIKNRSDWMVEKSKTMVFCWVFLNMAVCQNLENPVVHMKIAGIYGCSSH